MKVATILVVVFALFFLNSTNKQAFSAQATAKQNAYESFKNVEEKIKLCDGSPVLQVYVCLQDDLKKSEEDLAALSSATEEKISKDLDLLAAEELKNRFIQGQRAWVDYRNAHCDANYVSSAAILPSSQTLSIALCKYRMTAERGNQILETFWR